MYIYLYICIDAPLPGRSGQRSHKAKVATLLYTHAHSYINKYKINRYIDRQTDRERER